jgi:hypothetical protein
LLMYTGSRWFVMNMTGKVMLISSAWFCNLSSKQTVSFVKGLRSSIERKGKSTLMNFMHFGSPVSIFQRPSFYEVQVSSFIVVILSIQRFNQFCKRSGDREFTHCSRLLQYNWSWSALWSFWAAHTTSRSCWKWLLYMWGVCLKLNEVWAFCRPFNFACLMHGPVLLEGVAERKEVQLVASTEQFHIKLNVTSA